MILFDPRHQFQSDEQASKEFRTLVRTPAFSKAVLHATAMFIKSNPTADQIVGANRMTDLLLNIAEPSPEPNVFPDKTMSLHRTFQPKQEPTEKK